MPGFQCTRILLMKNAEGVVLSLERTLVVQELLNYLFFQRKTNGWQKRTLTSRDKDARQLLSL